MDFPWIFPGNSRGNDGAGGFFEIENVSGSLLEANLRVAEIQYLQMMEKHGFVE